MIDLYFTYLGKKLKKSVKKSIASKLIFYVLLTSTLITTVFTSVSFYMDYSNEMNDLKKIYQQIQTSYATSLAGAIWDINKSQVEQQLEGILNFHDVTKVTITERGKTTYEKIKHSDEPYAFVESKRFELHTIDDDLAGTLDVHVTKSYMYKRLFEKVVYFFVTQGLKTLLISFMIFMVFQMLVSRHIVDIVNQIKLTDLHKWDGPEIKVDRKGKSKDELDFLVHSINDNISRIRQLQKRQAILLEEKDETIEQQKSKIFNSAKLASIGEMAGGVADEINNPLAIISGQTYKLQRYVREQADQEQCSKSLTKIDEMILRITKIVDGLKYLSHDQSDHDGRQVEVKKIVESTLNLCQEKFNSRGIKVQVKIPSNFKLYCREVQISQVLLNLLNNAYEAAKNSETPIIKLEVVKRDEYAEFSVINSGLPINESIADKIFDPFFTTKVLGKGTGLGLSISKGIANSHQGDLFLDKNKDLTTFTMRIPLVSKDSDGNKKIAV